MRSLNSWIEAQLKKGYSASHIKHILVIGGYPQKAAAQADRIASSAIKNKRYGKKSSLNKLILVILLIGAMIVGGLLVAPFFKQPSVSIDEVQKPVEQPNQEVVIQAVSEEELRKLKEIETNKNIPKELGNDFCNKNIPSVFVKEYLLNYHIDGSPGENVRWVASEQPKPEFSLFDGPKVFVVYSGNKIEGCGYKQEIINKELAKDLKDKKGMPISCNNAEWYVNIVPYDLFDSIYIDSIESEEKITKSTIFAVSGFIDKEEVLADLGCENE